jgi:hypothetical protein
VGVPDRLEEGAGGGFHGFLRTVESLRDLAREVHETAVGTHRRFDLDVWRARAGASVARSSGSPAPSYHCESHVEAVVACARAVFAAAEEGLDPFVLRRDLGAWNAGAGAAVDRDDLAVALEIAFSCHDLGNVTRSAELVRGPAGEPILDLGLQYDSSALYPGPEVEIRSAAIASGLLAWFQPGGGLAVGLEPLIRRLVLSTVFRFEVTSSLEPFWPLMQTVDMVGSYFFSGVPRCFSVAGLFNEMRVQRPGTVRLGEFLGSLHRRFELLLPDPGRRADVTAIFERNPHGFRSGDVFPVPDRFAADPGPIAYEEAIRLLLDGEEIPRGDGKG